LDYGRGVSGWLQFDMKGIAGGASHPGRCLAKQWNRAAPAAIEDETKNRYFAQARRSFEENLQSVDPGRDPTMYNFYAGMVALASGLEIEISAMKQRLERIEAELSTRPRWAVRGTSAMGSPLNPQICGCEWRPDKAPSASRSAQSCGLEIRLQPFQ
jgi:hypothetical protein